MTFAEATALPAGIAKESADRIEPGVYTFPQAARRLGISLARAYRLDNAGQFPVNVLHFGAVRKVRVAELERFFDAPAPASDWAEPADRLEALNGRLRQERPFDPPTLTLLPGGLAD